MLKQDINTPVEASESQVKFIKVLKPAADLSATSQSHSSTAGEAANFNEESGIASISSTSSKTSVTPHESNINVAANERRAGSKCIPQSGMQR
jgi:hypothetical protein